ncbi:outer membrane protein assembly factor BamE [Spiribacter sp. C176]|uniref:Outer membrane protein assembly factor BamE n=2 Tax=Spiribacter salilacus TaxID=2664894 RepID=A0A6N7QPX2_9GAMM|nr:outer membrane protein assembly factor BamE [Spiribacter salilacus]
MQTPAVTNDNQDGFFRMITVYTFSRNLAFLLIIILLAGCARAIDGLPIVYQPELRQGTLFTQENVAQLEPGMNERQVRFLLGPATIEDPFIDDRWDYVYQLEPRSTKAEPVTKRLTVYFDQGALIGAEGEYIEPGHPLYR